MIKKIFKKIGKFFSVLLMYFRSIFWKKDDGVVLFGSWMGHRYADTSRFLYQYLSLNKEKYGLKNVVWVTREKDTYDYLNQQGYECYMLGTKESTYFHKRARFHIISNNPVSNESYDGDIDGKYSCRAIRINLWHGTMAMKGVGFAENNYLEKKKKHRIYYGIKEWLRLHIAIYRKVSTSGGWVDCYFLSTTKAGTNTLKKFFMLPEKKFLEAGNPRVCECLLHLPYEDEVIKRISKYKKIILYVPTFRRKDSTFDFYEASSAFKKYLKDNDMLWIQKPHLAANMENNIYEDDNILNLESGFDLNVIMKYISLLITDYSSVASDAMYYRKPLIFYTPDLDDYIDNDRGFIVDINEIMCGPIIKNKDELPQCVLNALSSQFIPGDKYERIRYEYWGEDSDYDRIWHNITRRTKNRRIK